MESFLHFEFFATGLILCILALRLLKQTQKTGRRWLFVIMYAFMFIPLMIMTTHGMDRSKDLLGIVGFTSGSAGAWIASLINTYLK